MLSEEEATDAAVRAELAKIARANPNAIPLYIIVNTALKEEAVEQPLYAYLHVELFAVRIPLSRISFSNCTKSMPSSRTFTSLVVRMERRWWRKCNQNQSGKEKITSQLSCRSPTGS
jgi:ribosomal protein L39E